jgi:hypothetical protein
VEDALETVLRAFDNCCCSHENFILSPFEQGSAYLLLYIFQ